MTQSTLCENSSRIHWTTVASLILWVSAFWLFISWLLTTFFIIFYSKNDLFSTAMYGVLLPMCSVLSLIMGIIAIVLSRKPAWKKSFGLALIDIIMSSILILFCLAYIIIPTIAFFLAFAQG